MISKAKTTIPDLAVNNSFLPQVLLWCGIASSVVYVLMNIFIPLLFDGYSLRDYTVSELSAVGAPTRDLWVFLAMFYILLFAAFGIGVLKSAEGNRSLRLLGGLIIAYAVINFYWPPMHARGSETSLTDTLHLVWAGIAVVLMMAMMGVSIVIFDRSFRFYTIATMVLLCFFGVLTSLQAPDIPYGNPTPWLGVLERIMISLFLLWIVVLASTLLGRYRTNT